MLEERLVEQPPLFVIAAPVELLWIFEQGETQFDKPGDFREILGGLFQAFGDALALPPDVAELLLDPLARHRVVTAGDQVDQLLFLGLKVAELCGELLPQ
ncbi:hypothetical protein M8542_14575 [Amycolatopsis sp. OK19-0408]|uniref:Uncharacterized protein n=1 Tax=Amycolatopsis iheyensis TaxID=2945988 RepID=A0A9X2SKN8_9PSEU|nr:hypothetical protein [Amycolatopsis iheyensis]MCR6484046.1 hypothetical protein [Amycolatopsis iheyensis]